MKTLWIVPVLAALLAGCQQTTTLLAPATTGPAANEAAAVGALRKILDLETEWNYQELDGNGRNDFWTRDVCGLVTADRSEFSGLRGVSMPMALADPIGTQFYPKDLKRMKPAPWQGYHFKTLLLDENGRPYNRDEDEDGQANTNPAKFGFVAYPAKYEADGKYTFVVSEAGVLWQKDLGGMSPPHQFPANPEAEGWDARERTGARGGKYEPRSRSESVRRNRDGDENP